MKKSVKINDNLLGPYSPALVSGNRIYLSGQLALQEDGNLLKADTAAQCKLIMENCGKLLEKAGFCLADLVQVVIYLTELGDFKAVNEVYASFLKEPYPSRVCIQAAALPAGAAIEIQMTAEK